MLKSSVDTTRIAETVDPSDKKEPGWNDQLEAIQYTTRVFAELDKQLGTDLVLARLDPAQREFIENQVKYAISLKKQIPNQTVADRIFLTLITEVLMKAILHRNVEKNVLIEIIGGVHGGAEADMQPEPVRQTLGGKLKDKIMPNRSAAEDYQ